LWLGAGREVEREADGAEADEAVEFGGVGSAMWWVVLGFGGAGLEVGTEGVDGAEAEEEGAEEGIWAGTDFCRPAGTK